MKKLYQYVGIFLGLSMMACSTDNDLESPLFGTPGDVIDGTVSSNPYWSWVAEFPGFVNVDEPRVDMTLNVKGTTSAGDSCWRSTGVYVVPGDTAILTIAGAVHEVYYRIGGFTDVLDESLTNLKRFRNMDFSGKLESGENKLMSYFGGHLYIYFKAPHNDLNIQVKGVVKSPDFVMNETDVNEWRNELEKTSVPYGELRSTHVILTLPVSDLKKISDPAALLSFYDDFIAEDCDGLYGKRLTGEPVRLRTDIQLTASEIDNRFGGSYPIVINQSVDSAYIAFPAMTSASDFMVARSFTLPYTLEGVIAELFRPAYYGLNYFRLCDRKGILPLQDMGSTVNSFVNSSDPARRFNDLTTVERTALLVQLEQEYGWNIYAYMAREMQQNNGGEEEQNRRDAMAMYAGEYANANLLPFFEDWGVTLSPVAQEYLQKFPAASPFWKNYNQKAGDFSERTAQTYAKANWPVYTDADRTGWAATSTVRIGTEDVVNMHDEKNNKFGPFAYLFDGNSETLWHSLWKAEGGRYPHTLTIDMKNEQTFNYLYFVQRSTSDNTNKCRRFRIYYKTGEDWVAIDNEKIFTLGKNPEMQRIYLSQTYKATELKIVLLSPHPANNNKFSDVERQSVPVSVCEFGVGEWK